MFFEGKEQTSSLDANAHQVDKAISNFYMMMHSLINAISKSILTQKIITTLSLQNPKKIIKALVTMYKRVILRLITIMAKNNIIYFIINSQMKQNNLELKLIIIQEMNNIIFSIINFRKKVQNLPLKLIMIMEMRNAIYFIINFLKEANNLLLELLKIQEEIHK